MLTAFVSNNCKLPLHSMVQVRSCFSLSISFSFIKRESIMQIVGKLWKSRVHAHCMYIARKIICFVFHIKKWQNMRDRLGRWNKLYSRLFWMIHWIPFTLCWWSLFQPGVSTHRSFAKKIKRKNDCKLPKIVCCARMKFISRMSFSIRSITIKPLPPRRFQSQHESKRIKTISNTTRRWPAEQVFEHRIKSESMPLAHITQTHVSRTLMAQSRKVSPHINKFKYHTFYSHFNQTVDSSTRSEAILKLPFFILF